VTTIGLGLSGANAGGLIVGSVLNDGVSAGVLARRFWQADRDKCNGVRGASIKVLARRYHKFPLYSLPADFVNVAAQQVPVVLLTNFFESTVVGFFSLTQRVLSLPLTLIASSIWDVFRQRASADFNLHGDCRSIYLKTLKSLVAISIVPFVLLFFAAPWLFSTVFGSEWRIAGEYGQILSPLFFLRFIASPLSYVLYVAGKQSYDLVGQVMLLVFAVSSVCAGAAYHNSKVAVQLYSGSYCLVYIYYMVVSFLFSKHRRTYAI
jgi:O-antigen/teichoic acid export membrane protein